MKSIYRQVAVTSIVIFLIAYFLDVIEVFEYDFGEIRSLMVIIYLIASYRHYKQAVKEKDETISKLKNKLKTHQNEE